MNIVFTPASILEILNQIDELRDYDIGITETLDGNLQLQVGTSTYELDVEDSEEIQVPEDVIDTVDEVNEDTYDELVGSYEEFENFEHLEDVEAGLIKEAIKSMLLGGAIKLAKKLM